MKLSLSAFLVLISACLRSQSCTAKFSFEINSERVTFTNQSLSSNTHYFWYFGDGTGSNYQHPIHEYPDNGTYMVTLYIFDTITRCSNYYDTWINVTKHTADPCVPAIADSIYFFGNKGYYKIINQSADCGMYKVSYGSFGGQGGPWQTFSIPQIQGNVLSCINFGDSVPRRVVLKTLPYLFDHSRNYNYCSSNFEWKVLSEDSGGQRILFTAMNKEAVRYTWAFSGFGDAIFRYTDTTSMYFPMGPPKKPIPRWLPLIHLKTTMKDGCRDSIYQRLMHRPINATIEDIAKISVETNTVKIYPSYVKDKFYADIDPAIQVKDISVVDATGRVVLIIPPENREADISALASGVYIVRVGSAQGLKTVKVIKE